MKVDGKESKKVSYYAGIGSRETPRHICDIMTRIAINLSKKEFILRSGHAAGADEAFERGALKKSEIYMPWKNFRLGKYKNDNGFEMLGTEVLSTEKELDIAWDKVCSICEIKNQSSYSKGAKNLIARDYFQIAGKNNHLSKFVVCWTKDGKASGGTGYAIKIALHYKIPIYNMFYDEVTKRILENLT